uniref:Ovule protein n=1 Tax=Brugia timori TaxID=42155 RepID=A0A0R3QD31_9BILA
LLLLIPQQHDSVLYKYSSVKHHHESKTMLQQLPETVPLFRHPSV